MNNYNFGLKLWSINDNYINEAIKLYQEGYYQYIELYAVPYSYDKYSHLWLNLKFKHNISFLIHAPHYAGGLKLSQRESLSNNLLLADETKRFADKLQSDTIIFHPGIGGKTEETVFQLNKIKDQRIIIENKPYYAFKKTMICNGHSPEEIKYIMKNAQVGFCLDIVHAICAANALKKSSMEYLKEFITLEPRMIHLSDSNRDSIEDTHLNLGKGSLDLSTIIKMLSLQKKITIESDKNFNNDLDSFKKDIQYLQNIVRTI